MGSDTGEETEEGEDGEVHLAGVDLLLRVGECSSSAVAFFKSTTCEKLALKY